MMTGFSFVDLPECVGCGDDAPVLVDGSPLCSTCALINVDVDGKLLDALDDDTGAA